ncbi:MAG: hypothetical protein JWO48_3547 [Bryobacterales bacterium]|nr:hypothetical protein [Bryobacterales bacterium]
MPGDFERLTAVVQVLNELRERGITVQEYWWKG